MFVQFDQHSSSFRDPSGFLFYKDGALYRQVNKSFQKDFDQFINGGLYQHLVGRKLLIAHEPIPGNLTGSPQWHATLRPEPIPFISYPYEWCFDMLKDAALVTLQAAREAISFGMILKDATAYNIQLHRSRPTFIDTLSFEQYDESKSWVAYRQFCQHFFAPLALMHYLNKPLQGLLLSYFEGIPLDITSEILPFKSKLNLHTYLHVHLQASLSQKQPTRVKDQEQPFTSKKMLNLLESLEHAVSSFSFKEIPTVWSTYYPEAENRGNYLSSKRQIVDDWLHRLNFESVLDVGANEGEFTSIAATNSDYVISADQDHASINKLYNKVKQQGLTNIYPVIIDFANPSPSIGVNNEERASFLNRAKVDLALALALVHHLALGKNIPFSRIASMFFSVTNYLVIEFVPPYDEKVVLLTEHKKQLLATYTEEHFLQAFDPYFTILERHAISNSGRTLFLMKKLGSAQTN